MPACGNHKVTQYDRSHVGNCYIQSCFIHPYGLTVSTKISNLYLQRDDSSNKTENQSLKNSSYHTESLSHMEGVYFFTFFGGGEGGMVTWLLQISIYKVDVWMDRDEETN